jgi:hypothetical protein
LEEGLRVRSLGEGLASRCVGCRSKEVEEPDEVDEFSRDPREE